MNAPPVPGCPAILRQPSISHPLPERRLQPRQRVAGHREHLVDRRLELRLPVLPVIPRPDLAPLWDPELQAEGAKHITWEIADIGEGIATLTVTHELEGAPKTAVGVSGAGEGTAGGGWPWVLSDFKSLLETGKSMSR
jgi:hypothetical protein